LEKAKCGVCGSENIKFVVRVVDDNEYYELRCMDCGAILSFGQHIKREELCFLKEKMLTMNTYLTMVGINGKLKSNTITL
jgi:hypothetical protein